MSSIKDVAKLAGVSISTVSRVLNETAHVSADKKERVLEAVKQLDYSPNPAARSLLLRKTGVIGVVVPFASGEFFSEFLKGVDQTASDLEYFLLISISHRSEADLRKAIRSLEKRVDGLIVWAPEMKAGEVLGLLSEATHVLLLNTYAEDGESDLVDFDNYGGMCAVVEHLVGLGHRDIAFLGGPSSAVDAKDRLRAYRDTISQSEIPPRPELEFDGDFTVEAGYAAAARIMALQPRPSAVAAANDQSAFGIIRGLLDAGLEVPSDISVTGFDDVPSSRYMYPPLTTARVPVRQMGELAVETLVDRIIENRKEPRRELVNVELVVRMSTGPPSASRS